MDVKIISLNPGGAKLQLQQSHPVLGLGHQDADPGQDPPGTSPWENILDDGSPMFALFSAGKVIFKEHYVRLKYHVCRK